MEAQNLNLLVAFGAGVLSFVSPCVLPLVPVYLGYLSGATVGEESENRAKTVAHAFAFVMGFTLVFVVVGASVGLVGYVLFRYLPLIVKVGGVILVVLGLHLTGLVKIPFLYMEKRLEMRRQGGGTYGTSFLVGMVFAFGWSPCVGPILSGILLLASASQTVARGALLLAAYSLGLGLPFLITAFALTLVSRWLKKLNRYMNVVSIAAGVFLIIMGVLLFTGWFERLNAYFTGLSLLV